MGVVCAWGQSEPRVHVARRKLSGEARTETARQRRRCWADPRRAASRPSEPEASWSFRGDTATARRAPRPLLGRYIKKKRDSRKEESESRSNPRKLRSREQRGLKTHRWRAESSQRAQVPPALRCAALMASLLGNGSRASGAQSGQVKCKLKRRRRRRSKRKGTTLPRFGTCRPLLSFFVPGRGGAHLGGSSQRYSPRKSRSHAAAPRRLHFANI